MKPIVTSLATSVAAIFLQSPAGAGEKIDLIDSMRTLQLFAHKLALAIDHENRPLANFYAHELEDELENSANIDEYDGKPIGQMTRAILLPALEILKEAFNGPTVNWDEASGRFDRLIERCNSCHQATDHGFIHIVRTTENPFMQSFESVHR